MGVLVEQSSWGNQPLREQDQAAMFYSGAGVQATITIGAVSGIAHVVTALGAKVTNDAGAAGTFVADLVRLLDSINGALVGEFLQNQATIGSSDRLEIQGCNICSTIGAQLTFLFISGAPPAGHIETVWITWYDTVAA